MTPNDDLQQAAPQRDGTDALQTPQGTVLAPHYRGFAHLGAGGYFVFHTGTPDGAELIISLADEESCRTLHVGDETPPIGAVQPEQMAVRIRFASAAALDVLENQLRHLRAEHFPESVKMENQRIAGAVYGFAGALTTNAEPITLGATHDAAPAAERVQEFLRAQGLDGVEPDLEPRITRRELEFAVNFHGDDARIGAPDHQVAGRYFDVVQRNRGTHPSLGGPEPAAAAQG